MTPEQTQGLLICAAILTTTLAVCPVLVWGIGWRTH